MFTHNHARSLKKDLLFCRRQKNISLSFQTVLLFGFQFAYPGGPPDMQKRRTFHTTPRGVVPKALLQETVLFGFSSLQHIQSTKATRFQVIIFVYFDISHILND